MFAKIVHFSIRKKLFVVLTTLLLLAGGICYSIGCVFYVLKKIPYMHTVFHLWVLAGSILQFLSIVLYVL